MQTEAEKPGGVICAAAECTTGGSRRRTADSRAITDTASGAVYHATGAGTGDAGSGTEEAECGISGRNHCIVGGWRNLYSDRTGIAWYVFYERLDQRYFFICSFPGSGIDRRITDPQKASETGPDLSAIGIAALYLSTMINTISLHNFGMLPAAVIIAVIAVGNGFTEQKKGFPDTQNAGNRSMLALCVSAFRFFIAFGAGRPAGAGIDSVTECTEHLCAGKKISYGFAVDTTCQHYDPFPGNGILCDRVHRECRSG